MCLSTVLYSVVSTTYPATTTAACHRVVAASPMPATSKTVPTIRATPTGMAPLAIGRYCLIGWLRSFSTSRRSFQKYVPLLARQNATKMTIVVHSDSWVVEHAGRARCGEDQQVLDPLLRTCLPEKGCRHPATTSGTSEMVAPLTHTA